MGSISLHPRIGIASNFYSQETQGLYDKLYLNKIQDIVSRLQTDGKIDEDKASEWLDRSKAFNQTHEVSVFRKK